MTQPFQRPAVRLQKILADAGVASRRAAEQLIISGVVSVNGQTITELGARADPSTDEIRVRGEPLPAAGRYIYLALNKPRGYVTTTHDERGRRTVLDLLPEVAVRVFPVGRLDIDSEGLLVLTNDGELTARLTHPRHGVEKVYEVLTSPIPTAGQVDVLRAGVEISGGRTAPARVRVLPATSHPAPAGSIWLEAVIHEGRNRQVRQMCAAIGLSVYRLVRTGIGPIRLTGLRSGSHRPLSATELRLLRAAAGLADNT